MPARAQPSRTNRERQWSPKPQNTLLSHPHTTWRRGSPSSATTSHLTFSAPQISLTLQAWKVSLPRIKPSNTSPSQISPHPPLMNISTPSETAITGRPSNNPYTALWNMPQTTSYRNNSLLLLPWSPVKHPTPAYSRPMASLFPNRTAQGINPSTTSQWTATHSTPGR